MEQLKIRRFISSVAVTDFIFSLKKTPEIKSIKMITNKTFDSPKIRPRKKGFSKAEDSIV